MTALPRIRLSPLTWVPHLPPVEIASATPEQLAAMQVTPSAKKISPYVRTLAHDPESYVARTTLFNAIMYVEGGLPRADRELGALQASLRNGCRYCANVHARQHAKLSGASDVIAAIWTAQMDRLNARDAAIVDLADSLTRTPPDADTDHIARLKAAGMDEVEIIDLIHAIAIFGWANRLMHTLGHS
ncbi:alkylhydroperoxidase [Pacificitalea manganoxidans]|uniref:Alkylhydroperoxidase n=1 Tax=Pacificitalea manganoxidans TaxID=1411902 RepID=A0A291LWR8_9RHOB|nr:peroxidase-related enzyme [Pacificitalea manganoxidans]ATI41149.1 alkylhydroperoxidase [Pacificitalea manganoxidans]MDR6308524.1 putative peroxidase-related enzyme [Pacificitalea manganoxidans]